MDNEKDTKKQETDNSRPLKDENDSSQSSPLQEKKNEDVLTDEDWETEKKLHEAQTERD